MMLKIPDGLWSSRILQIDFMMFFFCKKTTREYMGSPINKAAQFTLAGEEIWLGELYGETKQSMQQFWNNSQLLSFWPIREFCCHDTERNLKTQKPFLDQTC